MTVLDFAPQHRLRGPSERTPHLASLQEAAVTACDDAIAAFEQLANEPGYSFARRFARAYRMLQAELSSLDPASPSTPGRFLEVAGELQDLSGYLRQLALDLGGRPR